MDQRDQLRLAGYRLRQDRVSPSHTVWLMGITASRCQLSVLPRKLKRSRIGFRRFTAVERLHEIKPLHDLRRLIKSARIGETHIFLTARMRRSQDTAVAMHEIDQYCKGIPLISSR